jgi:flavin-dependent dehydrogenase
MAYYSYYSGIGLTDTDLYVDADAAVYGWPTNDGLSIMGIMRPGRDKAWYRDDIEENMMSDFEMVMPEWAERIRAGRREERISGSVDTPSFFRQAFGPGWVLAGDAGHTKDPITAFGITDAFRAADAVAIAIDEGLSGRRPLDEALADYQRTRDEKALPLYEFTLQLSSFPNSRTREEFVLARLPAAAAA